MLWLVIATIGDIPIAILACGGLLLGVWVMARGTRADAGAAASPVNEPPAPAAAVPAPPPVADAPQPTTFRQGAIRLGLDAPPSPPVGAPDPQASPSQPAAPPLPQAPPHGFRQGRIRVGGVPRGKPPPDE